MIFTFHIYKLRLQAHFQFAGLESFMRERSMHVLYLSTSANSILPALYAVVSAGSGTHTVG